MIKKLFALLLALTLTASLFSCDKEKVFGHAELRISLDGDFSEFEAESFDAAYANEEAVVGILRISYEAAYNSGIPDFLTTEQFAKLYMKQTGRVSEIKTYRGTPYYEYTDLTGGVENSYIASFYRSKYAYFAVFLATPAKNYSEISAKLLSYTETVIFVY
ncbi:MAG: hypothetical protein IJW38_00520 [Clostridia bacterium]|nr:hypothetical protein [Clostridia bacterium]